MSIRFLYVFWNMGLQAHLERESWCCFVCVYVLVSVSLPQCYPSLTVWWFCGRLHWFPQASQSRIRSYNGSSELCPRTCQGSPDPTRSPHGSVHFLVMGCLLDPNLLSDFALQLLQGPGPPPPPPQLPTGLVGRTASSCWYFQLLPGDPSSGLHSQTW